MMYRLVLLFALATFSSGQQFNRDPKTAAILNEARYLSVDGKFGAAYKQEDGVEFKEESDADGTRRGSYSYVDPTGQRRTISYVAGKNGFQATGDHLPVGPAPVPTYTPLPQYNPPQQSNDNQQQNWDDGNDGRWEQPQPQPQPRPQPQWNPPAQQQWNPPQQAYNPPPRPQPQPQWNPPAQPQQQQQQQQQQQWNNYDAAPQPQWNAQTTTPAPHRFYPPGKLNLNRSPDGFSFTFNKS